MNSNEAKSIALGMPHGTANNKLRKSLLFKFSQLLEYDFCYQCGKKIETIEEFSIEHKIPWMGTSNPLESFLDLNNIAFSHLLCNNKAGEKRFKLQKGHTIGRFPVKEGFAWCSKCGEQPLENFTSNKYRWSGVQDLCKKCRSGYRSPKLTGELAER